MIGGWRLSVGLIRIWKTEKQRSEASSLLPVYMTSDFRHSASDLYTLTLEVI
jgi:hypothetical protein